jgi:hypothetical protein
MPAASTKTVAGTRRFVGALKPNDEGLGESQREEAAGLVASKPATEAVAGEEATAGG